MPYVIRYEITVVYKTLARVQDAVRMLFGMGAKNISVLKVLDETTAEDPETLVRDYDMMNTLGQGLFALFGGKQVTIEIEPKCSEHDGAFSVTLYSTGIPVKAGSVLLGAAYVSAQKKEEKAKAETVQIREVEGEIKYDKLPEPKKGGLKGLSL